MKANWYEGGADVAFYSSTCTCFDRYQDVLLTAWPAVDRRSRLTQKVLVWPEALSDGDSSVTV